MSNFFILGVILFFAITLTLLIWIKRKSKGSFEITNTDVILALLPIIIFLLLSNKIKSFKYGDLEIEIAFKNAQNKNIVKQISEINIKSLTSMDKGGVLELEEKLSSKPEALKFIMGYSTYVYYAVEEYLTTLSNSTVKYILFEDANKDFVGIISLYDLNNQILNDSTGQNIRDFTTFLKQNDKEGIKSLLNGMITLENSVSPTTTKKDALEKMQKANTNFIPVVDESKKLLGILEDSKLTSSLLLDVSNAINE